MSLASVGKIFFGCYETTRDIELFWKERERMCSLVQIASTENERK